MIYAILVLIIIFLLYKEYKYSREVTSLIHSYLHLLKISYILNKKQTILNLKVYEQIIGEELSVNEYDQVYKTLTKAWEVPYLMSTHSSFADGKKIMGSLIKKINFIVQEPNYFETVKDAERKVKQQDSDNLDN